MDPSWPREDEEKSELRLQPSARTAESNLVAGVAGPEASIGAALAESALPASASASNLPRCRGGVDSMLCAGMWRPLSSPGQWRPSTALEFAKVGVHKMNAEEFEVAALTGFNLSLGKPVYPPCCAKRRNLNEWDAACGTNVERGCSGWGCAIVRRMDDPPAYAEMLGCNCDPPASDTEWFSPKERCHVVHWNAQAFCRLLGNRTISIIGDSVFDQAAATLINMILVGGGGCQSRISFHVETSGNWLDVLLKWSTDTGQRPPDFIIFGACAHSHSNDAYMNTLHVLSNNSAPFSIESVASKPTRERQIHDLKIVYSAFGMDLPRLYWKTCSPGGCGPAPDARTEGDLDVSNCSVDTTFDHSYERDTYLWRDELAVDHLLSHKTVAGIIDMRMLYRRPDAHISNAAPNAPHADCLHLCMRSAALSSTFPRLVMNELFADEEEELLLG